MTKIAVLIILFDKNKCRHLEKKYTYNSNTRPKANSSRIIRRKNAEDRITKQYTQLD